MTDPLVTTLRAAGCVFAEDEARLLREQARTDDELDVLLRRRVAGEPLEHVLGWAEFEGLRVPVAPGVFVPRRRTGVLVAEVVAAVERTPGPVVIVDVCCGSGAVAAAVAARLGGRAGVEIHAADVDPAAVRSARATLDHVAEVHQGDLLAALPDRLRRLVTTVAASPPYVPTDAVRMLPPEARDHEPLIALDGGPDGLDVVRRLAEQTQAWLAPRGHLMLDLGQTQSASAASILDSAGFDVRIARDQDVGATVVAGRRRS